MGNTTTTLSKMVAYYEASGCVFPSVGNYSRIDIIEYCQMYLEEAGGEGVRAEVAFVQAMKETGWLQYGGDVNILQYNMAGIGAVGGGAEGASFDTIREGIRAQIQHLKAYASTNDLINFCVDPRFELVSRNSAPYVEWLGIHENPYGAGWAAAYNYGYDIVDMIETMNQY
jgi:hypothetical protein